MAKYLGEEIVDIPNSEFKDYTKLDWVLYFIEYYGQFDGGHHKQWVLDQIVRIIKDTTLIVTLDKWDDGSEQLHVNLNEPTQEYLDWVEYMKVDEMGNEVYDYDEGIAP